MQDAGIFSGQRAGLTIGILLAITIVAFEALAVGTVMPKAEEDLGHLNLYGWVFSGFLLASVIGITWAGEQADHHGPGRPLAVGFTFFTIGLLIAGLAPTMHVLVLGRIVQGLGAGALPPVVYVIIGRGYPEEARPRMLAMLATAWVVPGFIGPVIGGAVAEWISWRATFLMIVPLLPLAAALILPAIFRLGAPAPTEAQPSKLPVAARLTAGAAFALAGVATGNPWFALPMVVAGVAFGFPALRRLLPEGTLAARRGMPAAIAGNGFLNMAFFSADAFIPYLLTTYRGYSTFVAGLALTSATISWTAGSWLQERLTKRTSRAGRAFVGGVLVTVGLAATSVALIDEVPGGVVALTWAIAGLGIGIAYPTFSLEMLAGTTAGREGEISSAMKLTETLSGAAGIGIAGGIVAAGEAGGWEGPALGGVFALAGVAGLLTTFIATRLSRIIAQEEGESASEPAGRLAAEVSS
jgi:MFS family permease